MNNQADKLKAVLAKKKNVQGNNSGSLEITLDEALEQFLWQFYIRWYRLPLKSTRLRYLNEFGPMLAQELQDVSQKKSSAIQRFTSAMEALPGVCAETDTLLNQLVSAAQSNDIAHSFSADPQRLDELVNALTTQEPMLWALAQMDYRQAQHQVTWERVQRSIQANLERLPGEVQETWLAIQQQSRSSTADYEAALDAVALRSQLALIALDALVDGKTYAPLSGKAMRGENGLSNEWSNFNFGVDGKDQTIQPNIQEPVEHKFFTDIHFPPQVQPGEEYPLWIQLTIDEPESACIHSGDLNVSVLFEQETELVEVVIMAPGFEEVTGHLSRLITLYPNQDSQPAVFLLKADTVSDEREVSINFYHRGRPIGSTALRVVVGDQADEQTRGGVIAMQLADGPARFALEPLPISPPPPVDLELRIIKESAENKLHFLLHSAAKGVNYHWKPMGCIELTADDPAQFLEHRFQRLSQLAGTTRRSEDSSVGLDEMQALGEELFEQLFPEKLQNEYWAKIKKLHQAGKLRSLLITSDEPWIPWELIKPYRYDDLTEEEESDDFLCQTFEVCRWLAGRGPVGEIQVEEVRIVVPSLDLPYVEKERDYFTRLADDGVTNAGEPLQHVQDVTAFAQHGKAQIVHIATHGEFDPAYPNRSSIHLQDGALTPDLFRGSNVRGWRKHKPILFLNTCHGGRMNFDLCGLGGWAQKMVGEIGIGAFIGAQWEIHDRLASAFAIQFYDGLQAGQTLGKAFHAARQHIREMEPENPTWLAYTLYGDPNARVMWAVQD